VLLPAGFGAFLGHLRLLPCRSRAGKFSPVIEAHTWISRDLFTSEQADVEDILGEAINDLAAFDRLASALARLRHMPSRDRRLEAGLEVVTPAALPSASGEKSLAMIPEIAFLRLRRNMTDPDRFARDYRATRSAA
jgi:hypothetical protein